LYENRKGAVKRLFPLANSGVVARLILNNDVQLDVFKEIEWLQNLTQRRRMLVGVPQRRQKVKKCW
jgi:hypothetical protein